LQPWGATFVSDNDRICQDGGARLTVAKQNGVIMNLIGYLQRVRDAVIFPRRATQGIKNCPICSSSNISKFQKVYLQRQKTLASQYRCNDCESFFHRSGYKENAAQIADDTQWFIAHQENSSDLVDFLRSRFHSHAPSCFEAGCGIGHVLQQFSAAGFQVSGIDPNLIAINYGRQNFGLAITVGYFTALVRPVDLIICMDVMEHLEQPAPFACDLIASAKPGGYIAVRVPMVRRDRWKFLETAADPEKAWDLADPFLDNSVHITHFSPQGLVTMMERHGAVFDCWFGEIGIFRRR
jgi:2-polyprenyl-3-methyl-5-hydroxy-6-metoxy-1,4-benzoquinol methylase